MAASLSIRILALGRFLYRVQLDVGVGRARLHEGVVHGFESRRRRRHRPQEGSARWHRAHGHFGAVSGHLRVLPGQNLGVINGFRKL